MKKDIKTYTCEICDSDQIEVTTKTLSIKIPFGPDAQYEQKIQICRNCGEEFDITDDSDRMKAISISEKRSLEAIINFITSNGLSLANIERALDLPQRTISRWKSGQEPSAAGLSLLRLIRLFPWLIEVAEKNYDEYYANHFLFSACADIFIKMKDSSFSPNDSVTVGALKTDQNNFTGIFSFSRPDYAQTEASNTEMYITGT